MEFIGINGIRYQLSLEDLEALQSELDTFTATGAAHLKFKDLEVRDNNGVVIATPRRS
ncbi:MULTISPECIES: hypothetical protein [Actinomycetaceae]|uniref:hypothetical protein n=1 Tax=Actinomycetaceae TaxID=2049 RepID=UPI0013FD7C73|nr:MULTISPECIES: hypothetical protein [Actinomycetaceae]MDK6399468.1 hypothetical protein [Pauljensenia sp. UMB9872]MDK7172285.1 hypothetical protein [Pauljensenia sp. UMB1235]